MMSVEEAITGRRSIRAFLPKPVPRELIANPADRRPRAIGTNIQPWRVWVLDGKVRDEVVREMKDGHDDGDEVAARVPLRPAELARAVSGAPAGLRLRPYGTIGIARGDKERMRAQQGRNYAFFDAPVGLIFSIDRDLEIGSLGRLRHVPAVDHGRRRARSGSRPVRRRRCARRHEILQKRLGIPAGADGGVRQGFLQRGRSPSHTRCGRTGSWRRRRRARRRRPPRRAAPARRPRPLLSLTPLDVVLPISPSQDG